MKLPSACTDRVHRPPPGGSSRRGTGRRQTDRVHVGECLKTVLFRPARMPSLVFLAGPIAGRRYKLADGEYIIGRRSDCQIFVPAMRVSRQHARLWQDGESWQIEDLGSNNGTFVNGTRVAAATTIRHEDEILIANNKIRVEANEPTLEPKAPEGNVTIVDVSAGGSLIRSREDSGSGRM